MPRLQLRVLICVTPFVFSLSSWAADGVEYACSNGNLQRRVVIEAANPQTGLPCEVVYWKDAEAPGVRRVLWNARTDRNFCDSKAAGLVDKLRNSGWNCGAAGNTAAAGVPTVPPVASPGSQPNVLDQSVDAAATSDLSSDEDGTGSANTGQSVAAVPSSPSPEPQGSGRPAGLEAVIAQNVESLNQSVDGDFKAEIGDYGDLNGDGLEDVVVFFNYQSSTADFTQFVAAYLNNGASYHLAATKPVGGSDRSIDRVEIEDITEGLIRLRLHGADPTSPQAQQTVIILKDGQLVEAQ